MDEQGPGPEQEVGEFLETLDRLGQRRDWKRSEGAQVQTLLRLSELREHMMLMPGGVWEQTIQRVGAAMEWSPARFKMLLALGDVKEIRRAIRYGNEVKREPPRLPEEKVYPTEGLLGSWLRYCEGGEVPLAYHFWSGVAMMAAACRRNVYIDRNTHYIYPNVYIVLVGKQGLRKGQAHDMVVDVIQRTNQVLAEEGNPEFRPEHRRIRVLAKTSSPAHFLEQMKAEDPANLAMGNPPGAMFEPPHYDTESTGILINGELSTLMGKNAVDGPLWIPMLTELYNCGDYVNGTITSGFRRLHNVALTCLFATAPDWMRSTISQDIKKGGFLRRTMFCFRETSGRVVSWPSTSDPIAAEALARDLAFFSGLNSGTEFTLTRAGRVFYDEWYFDNHATVGSTEAMESWYTTKDMHLLKLAMILGLSNGKMTAGVEELEKAMDIFSLEETYMPGCFGEISRHDDDVKKETILSTLSSNGSQMTMTEISQALSKTMGNSKIIRAYIKDLEMEQRVKITYEGPRRGMKIHLV